MEGPISEELLRCVTVISPNETELERMTGMPVNTDEEINAAATSLLCRGVEAVLLKLGAKGSVMMRAAGRAGACCCLNLGSLFPCPPDWPWLNRDALWVGDDKKFFSPCCAPRIASSVPEGHPC